MGWNIVDSINPCAEKAFNSCPYKEADDEFCEICICEGILFLKKRLRSLHRRRKEFNDGKKKKNVKV